MGGIDVLLSSSELSRGTERAKNRRGILGVTDLQAGEHVNDAVDDLVMTGPGNDQPRQRDADLSLEGDEPGHQRRQNALERDVAGDDRGGFPAKLQRDAGDALGGRRHDRAARDHSPGQAHLVNPGMVNQRGADVRRGREHAYHALREAGLVDDLREHSCGQVRLLSHLPDDGAPG